MTEKNGRNKIEEFLCNYQIKNQSDKAVNYLDVGIIILAIIIFILIYNYDTQELTLKYILMGVSMAVVLYYFRERLIWRIKSDYSVTVPAGGITTLSMLNENGNIIKEWDIRAKVSLVIGKSGKSKEVAIDLSESMYDGLIHDEHAVMNFANGDWYLEGLHTPSGISLKKVNDQMRYRLTDALPLKIQKGDVIYIAKTRLLVK